MKKLMNLIFSSKATLVLLIIFTIAIGGATFIEDKYDTVTAKLLIYNAKWFEFLLLLLVLNFIGSIKRYHLYRIGRLPGLLFHSAFIIIIFGAGITRYIGYEGSMHIREGESSNSMFSSEPHLNVRAVDGNVNYSISQPLLFGAITDNSFTFHIDTKEKGPIDIAYKDYIKNAIETYEEGSDEGIDIVELTVSVEGHEDLLQIKDGELKETHGFPIAYNNNKRNDALKIISKEGKLLISYPTTIKTSKMPEMLAGEIAKDSLSELNSMYFYEPVGSGIGVVLTKVYKNARIKYVSGGGEIKGPDALLVDVSFNGKTQEVSVLGGAGYVDNLKKVELEDIDLQIAYGVKKIELPFYIHLNKFVLERYSGSESPSSYASEVTLVDDRKGLKMDHRIFMNNVLDYDGYRFFQSSYDKDEKGTVLSVNHDFSVHGFLMSVIFL